MTIRTYEHRVYTLASAAAVEAYGSVYYPRHRVSLRELYDVTVHGYWSAADALEFHVLMSYPEGADPAEVRQRYREHPVAAANMPGFDPDVIRGVAVTVLVPAGDSPLR